MIATVANARIRNGLLAGLMLLGLLACMETPTETEASVSEDPPPVTTQRALALFQQVCGGSLPKFASAERRMTAAGITRKAPTGTVFSQTDDLSFKIVDGPGAGKSCSMVWGTTETNDQVARLLTAFRPFRASPLGLVAPYQEDVLLLLSPPARQDGVTYHNVRMLSQR